MSEDQVEKPSRRRHLAFLAKLTISLSLIAFLLTKINWEQSLALFAHANGWLIFVGGVLIFAQTALSAFKWQVLLRGQSIFVPFGKLLRTYLLANFVNLFTPGFIGGDAYRSMAMKAYTGGMARSLSAVLVDRITGFAVLVVLAAAGVSLYFAPANPWMLGAMILATIGLGYGALILLIAPLVQRLSAKRKYMVLDLAGELIAALRPSRTLWLACAIAFIFQMNIIFIVCIWSAGLHLSVSISQLFLIVPTVYMLEIFPISISGIGVREGAYALLFSFFHLPPEQGLALGLMTSVMRYVVGAVGSLAWFVPDSGTAPIRTP